MFNSTKYSVIDDDCIPRRDNEPEFNEWFEDAVSDADWIDNCSTTACSFSASTNSESFTYDVCQTDKLLAESKYKNLKVEHQKVIAQLTNEKLKSTRLQKKLRYLQDNHAVCSKLKEAYLNLKCDERYGKGGIEVTEQGCQTWDGIICQSCIKTHEMARQLKLGEFSDPSMITVKRCDLAKLQETVKKLKTMIDDREKTWSYNSQRETKYRSSIAQLQNQIKFLSEMFTKKQIDVDAFKTYNDQDYVVRKENAFLRKIIIKLEKRQRYMDRMCNTQRRLPTTLSEMETGMIQELIKKYSNKFKQKNLFTSATKNSATSNYKMCDPIDEEDISAFDEGDFITSSDCGSSI